MKEELWFLADCEDLADKSYHRVWVYWSGSSAKLIVDEMGSGVVVDAKTQEEVVAEIFIKLQMKVVRILSRAEAARGMNKHLEDAEVPSSDSDADDSLQITDEESEEPSESTPQQQSWVP